MPRNKRIKKKKEFIDYGDGADYNGGRSQIFRTYADHKYTTAGKHDERKDEHGFVSRCFTRKYTLPQSANVEKVTSSLSPDGMLTVETPLIKPAIEAAVTDIPVSVGSKSGVTKK